MTGETRGAARSAIRRAWDRTPLWARLVAAAVLLVTIALVLTGAVGTRLLRGYLVDQIDHRLDQTTMAIRHGGLPSDGRSRRNPTPYYAAATNSSGTVVAATPEMQGNRPDLTARQIVTAPHAPFTTGTHGGDLRWRVLVTPVTLRDGEAGYLVVAYDTGSVDATVSRLLAIDVAVGAAVLIAMAIAGYAAVRASLRPLGEIEATAAAIARGELYRRVPVHDGRTELGALATSLNGMLSQIESAFAARHASERAALESERRMRRFIADASHELRTPLTSIRGFAELHRQRGEGRESGDIGDAADADEAMRRIEGAATRMGLLVDDLLLLARLDQQRPVQRARVDLVDVAADVVIEAQAIDADRPVELELAGVAEGEPVPVSGDEPRLRQVLTNLVGNALTHTPTDTPVRVRVGVTRRGEVDLAVLEVADEGPGMPPEQAARVFERFYRADPSRGRAAGGAGLGLSIVASLAEAHGGSVELSTAPGSGATFRVLLPLATSRG